MTNEMQSWHLKKRTLLLHPLFVFSFVWLSVAFLYSLHLSGWLVYSTREVLAVTGYILIPFLGIVAFYSAFHHFKNLAYRPRPNTNGFNLDLLERRLTMWFRVWMLLSLFEILVSGGLPIIWLLRQSTKNYMDFGVTSLHGLVNALLLSVGTCRFALYLITGDRKHLRIPIFVLVWSVLAVTRAMMVESLVEYAVVFLSLRKIRPGTIARIVVTALLVVLVFGFVGDIRGGAESFRGSARPTAQYPDWLPSGVLWVYIYITTPINNLMYSEQTTQPANNMLFPHTTSDFVPNALRPGDAQSAQAGVRLVTSAFNVCTAYLNPYEDYGAFGMIIFSALTAFLCQFFWYRTSLSDVLIYAALTRCLIFTIFSNVFFAPSAIAKILWVLLFFMPKVRLGKRANSSFGRVKFSRADTDFTFPS